MSAIDIVEKPHRFTLATAVRMLIGALLGATLGGACVKFAMLLRVPVKSFTWSDTAAMILGGIFTGIGLVTFLISFNRREIARNLEGECATLPATGQEVSAVRIQSATLLLAGLMLLLPLAAMGTLAGIAGGSSTVFGAIVVLFILQTIANVRMWRGSDEFLRQLMLNTAALTFAVCQGALFLWAAAEHLHLAPPLSSWQAVMILMTVYLAIGTFFSLRARF